jgi:hypothetical protein
MIERVLIVYQQHHEPMVGSELIVIAHFFLSVVPMGDLGDW